MKVGRDQRKPLFMYEGRLTTLEEVMKKVEDKALHEATNGRPPPESQHLDENEEGIVEMISVGSRSIRDSFASEMSKPEMELYAYLEKVDPLALRALLPDLEAKVRTELTSFYRDRKSAREQLERAEREFTAYQIKADVDRGPFYTANHKLAKAKITFMTVGEAALGTPFFAVSHPYGLLGGFAYALGVAVVNCWGAFFAIDRLSSLQLTPRTHRNLLWVGAGALCLFQGLVAAWRAFLMSQDPLLDTPYVSTTLFGQVLAWDIHSLILCIIGIGFGLKAGHEGSSLHDSEYFGYENWDQRVIEATATCERTPRNFAKKIEALKEDTLARAQSVMAEAQKTLHASRKAAASLHRVKQRCQDRITFLCEQTLQVLRHYRATIKNVIKNPAKHAPRLSEDEHTAVDRNAVFTECGVNHETSPVEELKARVLGLHNQMEDVQAKIHACIDGAVSAITNGEPVSPPPVSHTASRNSKAPSPRKRKERNHDIPTTEKENGRVASRSTRPNGRAAL